MRGSSSDAWLVARFPSIGWRQEFLDRLNAWNRVEGFPRIETQPLPDGRRLRLRSAERGRETARRLVHSLGGWIVQPPRRPGTGLASPFRV
jgi:hypothetical protein